MKAILLAAGFGTRLRPLTETIPKCLVPVHGKPLLQIWLERLTNAGIGPFLVNTHYLPGKVEQFVHSSPFANAITIFHESVLLGTAGTLIANADFFGGEDGMLIHADNYCLADIRAFVQAHHNRPHGCTMTMMTFRTDHPTSCGIVELNKQGVVIGFHEKVPNPPGNLANGAVYILSAELISQLRTETDFSTEVLTQLTGKIYSYTTDATFVDIGTPEAYKKVNSLKS
jgi:mannose-1-phosphate guanylyltransferase